MEKGKKLDSRLIYKGPIFDLKAETFTLDHKPPKTWDVVVHPGATAVVPITAEGKILLVKQWRLGAERTMIEIPAGLLEDGEPPAACAQRELQEETGFRAEKLTPLSRFFSTPGFCNEYLHLFLALDLKPAPLPPDEHEEIELCVLTLGETLNMIDDGTICDAKTIAGILLYHRWLERQK